SFFVFRTGIRGDLTSCLKATVRSSSRNASLMTRSSEGTVTSFAWSLCKVREAQKPSATKTARYPSPMAGPYAETKEQLGGILLLDAPDLNHAAELMSKHPGIRVAIFEIRPLDEEATANVNAAVNQRASSSFDKYVDSVRLGLLIATIEKYQ